MSLVDRAWIVDNPLWDGFVPRLSVLTPFYRDDPRPLLSALEAQRGADGVEIVLLDDCGGDEALSAAVAEAAAALALPVRLVRLAANEGRARGRNRLAAEARAPHLLFLDSDMLPDGPGFLAAYVDLIGRQDPAVAFGGFTVRQAPRDPALALHRAMAAKSDCLDAEARARRPEKHVFTSNLLVRRDVFQAVPFDEAFTGWGWEDVEWAARVARRWPILHLDNTATHMGLDTPQALIAKYRQSADNFGRLAAAHPDLVAAFPSFRAARALSRLPLRPWLRAALRGLVLAPVAPLPLRAFALRLYRAALYAEVV